MDGTGARHVRILTVGDGDLSYSRSLLDKENWADLDVADTPSMDLTATTYDQLSSLLEKYAMAASNIENLTTANAAYITVHVKHNVDATSLSSIATSAELHFDRIVFHHPHTGVEDVHRHRRLLSHFFHAALQVLKPQGLIFVTLARDQPSRWEILSRATAVGLTCAMQSVWTPPKGYTRKRHQSDKSFHHVLLHGEKLQQESTLFRFGRQGDIAIVPTGPAAAQLVDAHRPALSLGNPAWEFSCDLCGGKRFATLQGKKTHMRMVHELNLKRKRSSSTDEMKFSCTECNGRMFADNEALTQHRLAKHGKDSTIRPDWHRSQPVLETLVRDAKFTCAICNYSFASQVELDQHWTTLQPIHVEKVACSICSKTFEDLRALRQHQNFCGAAEKLIEEK
ncbi:hypothetical protein H310_00251 [Aphanomyces invadans]|uniref:C2H2-type domain-containing protein n=1 Tax=Aphanomyces invadans TaxID=157072 RepID=A0A024UTC3_9STRA|nr:hypothetical protein H310_00251 [Aphanomyces invadans]ETW09766.1 hypothetical protein H310_00251 [Aphanomyces invadans]|eukprot:XP_008861177.1 hypothetical protein H310_00251 [Aphanomyces invadans]